MPSISRFTTDFKRRKAIDADSQSEWRVLARKSPKCLGKQQGGLSPLLGAVMLTPLDEVMQQLMRETGVYYVRYMDDFLILAPSRRVFRRAIKCVHQVLRDLQLRLHTEKRFIGRVCRGFDFLGYTVTPGRRLRPSAESHRRLLAKFRRLYEQGASAAALWRYVARWCG